MDRRRATDTADQERGKYTLVRDPEDFQAGIYDKPLPCFGCGIGWIFALPLMWYYATILYFGNYYRKDPRERGPFCLCNCCIIVYYYNIGRSIYNACTP